ncbi:MAG: 3,4-dihydroxy-2-butanone-4-phosphate synthase, partial [Sulfuricaulis sp.]|nr:3,4-dihydroxy-2-butanone-4-phosphate synthase [Sulfuricaulis sp.]
MKKTDSLKAALSDLRAGRPVVVVDSPHRENEADLIFPAESMDAHMVQFMTRECMGMACVGMDGARLQELGIPLIEHPDNYRFKPPMAASVDLKTGGTGSSAPDRAATMRALADPKSRQGQFSLPGHVFPLRAHPEGTLGRQGHTEAAVDLMRLSGFRPCGVLCEILNADGSMLRGSQVDEFCKRHGLVKTSVDAIAAYRRKHGRVAGKSTRIRSPKPALTPCVHRVSRARLPTRFGNFTIHAYSDSKDHKTHLALVNGTTLWGKKPVRVRLHSKCVTGDSLFSRRCDCGPQLEAAMRSIAKTGGII